MTLIGILHAIGTAGFQVCQTIAANGFGMAAVGHIFNIFGALVWWIIEGLTVGLMSALIIGIILIMFSIL